MRQFTLEALYRYPVKSLAGESFGALEVDARGFRHDRHWMVVDPAGRFMTQREQARMALIGTHVTAQGELQLSAPGMPALSLPVRRDGGRIAVDVWGDTVDAVPTDPAADAWLSAFLDTPCRLVHMADDGVRPVDPDFAGPQDQVGFADGFPFLLISQASLDDLNSRLDETLSMRRFRPNLVVAGCPPYAEDTWRVIRIGDIRFRVVKPCARCAIPTVDPDTGKRGKEPLRTLASFRRRGREVMFGQNLAHDGRGRLEVGMTVEVLE
ncbi:MOSC domain-containing protein [Denitromonas iodatirespirans]|uniref:MOSC domain-containing protein n=1 Tax=Denitromonas iodatirespirans TaxID=2795389 RepID=A0A944DDB4_DENI1|nr:MOSC N-terminal beta barrel domain-containing protein [Denitromonas iodatirespirans]MBT0963372.1 MOSC domain-containing protein [Denitromonas iodatirespirans]